jgi:hypothetical protein
MFSHDARFQITMNLIDSVKDRLHRDIVADPILHAHVLNLYLAGEAYPDTVDDYFPVEHVDCPELARRMQKHRAEETKHVALYAKAIEILGAEVEALPGWCTFNHVIRSHTREPWHVGTGLDRDARVDKVANFFAHAHFLEKRVARSLEYHYDACARARCEYPGRVVALVLADELHHVRYTREAVFDLVGRQRAADILEAHRSAEQRANLDFSYHQLRRLLIEEPSRCPQSRQWLYRSCAFIMQAVLTCA